MILLFGLLTACGGNNEKFWETASPVMVTESGISKLNQGIAARFFTSFFKSAVESQKDHAASQEKNPDPIVGTWTNKRLVYSELGRWESVYETSFSPDGRVAHYGNRNFDTGTWMRIDENTVAAYFDDCAYTAVGALTYRLPPYQVTYTYGENKKTLNRQTDRADKLTYDGGSGFCEATDYDTYEEPLSYSSDDYCVEYTDSDYFPYPKEIEYCTELEKELLGRADDLLSGEEVKLERADLPYELWNVSSYDFTGDGKPELCVYVEMCGHASDNSGAFYILSQKPDGEYTILSKNTDFRAGYTDILAPDGTKLLAISGYNSASSWKGGIRIHLSYRDNRILVDCEESYDFHWDLPIVNRIHDYQNGKFYVYVSRESDTEGSGYGSYVGIGQSLKIDEETFDPIQVPFTGYEVYQANYPDVYSLWSPFDEKWWQDGGSYPEDEEAYGRRADWAISAAGDNPDEMLQEAVEKSGLKLEKRAYPWTPETKKNVMALLRCPVADYYYRSDYYAAVYMRGEIGFYEKEILSDGYGEVWILMNPDERGILSSIW